jgi:uridine kinase
VRSFSLQFHLPGIVLQLPAPGKLGPPPAYQERPKLLRAFAEAARWAGILHCNNAADLNDMVAQKQIRSFIRVNEALQERSIADIAEQIAERDARIVLIAGPSSSGKTTFTHRLAIDLRVNGLEPVTISLDNYYLERSAVPLGEDGQPDLEALEALDVPLFNEHLVRMLQGEEVEIPRFSFTRGRREEVGTRLRLRPDQPVLIEGIHGLNARLTEDVPSSLKFKVFISALAHLNLDNRNRIRTTDVRLLRRLVRDRKFRNSTVEHTMGMWDSVRAGEERYIFPFQEEADIMFNSSLLYELAFLKKSAYRSHYRHFRLSQLKACVVGLSCSNVMGHRIEKYHVYLERSVSYFRINPFDLKVEFSALPVYLGCKLRSYPVDIMFVYACGNFV